MQFSRWCKVNRRWNQNQIRSEKTNLWPGKSDNAESLSRGPEMTPECCCASHKVYICINVTECSRCVLSCWDGDVRLEPGGIPKSRLSDRIPLDDGLLIACSPTGNRFIASILQEHIY